MKLARWGLALLILIAIVTLTAVIDEDTARIPLPQDPALLSGKLPNGLSYYIQVNKHPEKKAELRLFINAGSLVEDEDQRGLAHFTEHMAFNGTKNFAKSEMLDFLNSVGMGYMNGLNGMTSKDFTMYMFKIPTDNTEALRKGFVILSDMAYQVAFDPVELDKERGVIIEEWRMGQNAQSRVSAKTDSVVWEGSRYAERSPIGTYDVLSTFKLDTIKRFYHDWYRPDLQSVVVVGDFDPQDILALITEYFGKIPARENPRPLPVITVPEHTQPKSVVALDKELTQNNLSILRKVPPTTFKTLGDCYNSFARGLFFDMYNARMQERSQQANPPFTYAYAYEYPMIATQSVVTMAAMIGDGQTEAALAAMIQEADRIRKSGFTQSELDRAKLSLKRSYESAMANKDTRESDQMTWGFFSTITHGDAYLSPDQEYGLADVILPEITLDEVNNLIDKLISTDNQVITLEGVEKPGVSFPTAPELLSIAKEAVKTELPDYQDTGSDVPLLAEVPKPGKITKETTYRKAGIKRWTLSNGITVYTKKTDFKNDEVQFRAFSPGGYSKLPSSDMEAAKYLSWYKSESGLGELDKTSLDKALAGNIADVSSGVSVNQESFSGSCSPTDLELMFQMIYQNVKATRWDEATLASNLTRVKFFYQNRLLSPEQAFFDTLDVLSLQPNPYNKNTRVEDLDGVKLAQLQRIQQDRYGDCSDFTFVFVGNFDETKLRDYAATYLANLPTDGRMEKVKDVGLRYNRGKQKIVFQKGGTDKSYVGLITSGPANLDPQVTVDRNAMLMVLNEKLRENIREERSGVYFVQAYAWVDRYPAPYFILQTVMSCSADRVDELTDAVIATMDSVKAGLFADKYIDYAKVTLQKRYEESVRQNDYWLSQITSGIWNKRPLDSFLDNSSRFQKINRASIVKAANRFLPLEDNLIKVFMMPEDTP
ncbi:MAG TPA: insulinase family protein [Candidatus Cloacimonadota bacterium]|nr:insulinase family protein [Candidatus Cloacimonadota bacterium]HPS39266.1 insulinase family protein [Candidatus Cloacimonadota bacterium]